MITAVTHSGPFHADDVLATAILRRAIPDVEVVRSRDLAVIEAADIVYDVGGVYDPATKRLDHHQRGRAKSHPCGIERSSAGLVWEEYGHLLTPSEKAMESVDRLLILPVDAVDNGQALVTSYDMLYGTQQPTLSALIGNLNPVWHEEQDFDAAFESAVHVAGIFLEAAIARAASSEHIEVAMLGIIGAAEGRHGRVLVMDQFVPWRTFLFENGLDQDWDLVVYPDPAGTWVVACVPDAPMSRISKTPWPREWAGLPTPALVRATGIPDMVFCHPGAHIGGARTKKSALRLANAIQKAHAGEWASV